MEKQLNQCPLFSIIPMVNSTLDIQWNNKFEADIPAHIKYTYPIRSVIHRIVFKPAHIIHIYRIQQVVAGNVYFGISPSSRL